jgi:hypothetical protein
MSNGISSHECRRSVRKRAALPIVRFMPPLRPTILGFSRLRPITDAGLEQLGDGSLIGLEQFIRSLETFKPFAQRLNLLIMRLMSCSTAAISSRSRFLNVFTEFIVTIVPEGPPPDSYRASWLSLPSIS